VLYTEVFNAQTVPVRCLWRKLLLFDVSWKHKLSCV
jgi:hypothetical protein